MAVIPFPMDLSPQGLSPEMAWELRSLTARFQSPLSGVTRTAERPGAHFAVKMPYENLAESSRARLQTFVASTRGHASSFYVPIFGYARRGSFPAPELLTNNTFASGTTGWSGSGTPAAVLTAADGLLRVTQAGAGTFPQAQQTPTSFTQYAPYCFRSLALHGVGASQAYFSQLSDGLSQADAGGSAGLNSVSKVMLATTANTIAYNAINPAGGMAGDFFEIGYSSVARCALVDNGPNLLLQSDEFDTSWTTQNATVDDQAVTAPDGTLTADALAEDGTAAANHFVAQTATIASSALEYSFGCFAKLANRSWVELQLSEGTGIASAYFNLSAGTVGTLSAGTGWSNARAFITSAGDGWYYCSLVARKTSAQTSLTARIMAAEADNDDLFSGLTQNSIAIWRATLAQSSVPTRPRSTTTTASVSGTSQTGAALYLKGLPASTNGLLLQGDWVEIITGSTSQAVRVRSALNSDAAGLGYLEFEPPLRNSPADNAAVIVCNPLCRMMLDSNVAGWRDRAAGFSDLEFSAVEDLR